MQSPNFRNSFLQKEKASCKSLVKFLDFLPPDSIKFELLYSQAKSLYVASSKCKELVTRPIGIIISAILKVSNTQYSYHLQVSMSRVMVIFLCAIAFAVYRAAFGQENGPVLLSNVECAGNESSLLSCSRSGTPACSYSRDAGVVCPPCKLQFSLLSWYYMLLYIATINFMRTIELLS